MPVKRTFCADFETTVYDGQINTEVWAASCADVAKPDSEAKVFGCIEDQWKFFLKQHCSLDIYYHNLKFDGEFWLIYFLEHGYTQAIGADNKFLSDKEMPKKSFKYLISDKGQFYTITVKQGQRMIRFKDSYKLLPFSLERIGKAFCKKHKKLTMEYTGARYPNCPRTEKEDEYILADVLTQKEALNEMFARGHKRLTIGSCCYHEYKSYFRKDEWNNYFPNLYEYEIDENQFGVENAGEYIRKSYRGGWCYVPEGKAGRVLKNGLVADVNSLYPSRMHSDSGCYYATGLPNFWSGEIPEICKRKDIVSFVRIKTQFRIKPGKLPFIQIKQSPLYKGNDYIKTTNLINVKTGEEYEYYEENGEMKLAEVELTLQYSELQLFKEHYDVKNYRVLDGCWFYGEIGLFDGYINKYRELKMNSEGAEREDAKLFLNNLYGKFATSPDSSFKIAKLEEDGSLSYTTVAEFDKIPGYIAIGAAITSNARMFTIKAAQANYFGDDKPGFAYADTDSIHCNDYTEEELVGVPTHATEFNHWKVESNFDEGYFLRQKTYIERTIKEDGEEVDAHYNIKCAGMPKRCKNLMQWSMTYGAPDGEKLTDEEQRFVEVERGYLDFKAGLQVPSCLKAVHFAGGILLKNTTFTLTH